MTSFGTLYIVATPIGNLADISQRAIHTLQQVNVIAAEDTRHSQRLLQHYNITTPLFAYHDHNEQNSSRMLVQRLQENQSVALISDAGTPLVSDPGYRIVKAAHAAGIKVVPIPGACAAIAALSVAGLPTDHFIFEGFLPVKAQERQTYLSTLKAETRTLIFYEASHRIQATMTDLCTVFGKDRETVLARELTKTFETIYKNNLEELISWLAADCNQLKGEFVIIVSGAEKQTAVTESYVRAKNVLAVLLKELPAKQAVKLTVDITGVKKNLIYDWAMQEKENSAHVNKI